MRTGTELDGHAADNVWTIISRRDDCTWVQFGVNTTALHDCGGVLPRACCLLHRRFHEGLHVVLSGGSFMCDGVSMQDGFMSVLYESARLALYSDSTSDRLFLSALVLWGLFW